MVLKNDKAENGDTVTIDYVGTVDGVEFDGGSAQNYSLELGSNTFIPGFEDQLVGHGAGEEVDVVVTFPEDYGAKDLAGKEAHFATKIHEVKAKQCQNLTTNLPRMLTTQLKTLDELKEKGSRLN